MISIESSQIGSNADMSSALLAPHASRKVSLVVLVPTRNRATLARAAILSALEDDVSDVSVVVSDNSTEPAEQEELSTWCRDQSAARLRYIRPPEEMPMAVHWDWALQQAFELTGATHISYLTDRMVFRRGAVRRLMNVTRYFPDDVITYSHDSLDDYHRPIRLEELAWTGNVISIPSPLLLKTFAACRIDLAMPLPRLLNSIIPLVVANHVRTRYGYVCGDSVAPDFRFAFRCLTVVDGVLYFDRSELLSYALERSQGANYSRGSAGRDALDFAANLRGRAMNWASPVPEFVTSGNTMVSEYCATLTESDKGVLPPVVLSAYLDYVRQELAQIEDPAGKARMLDLLRRESERLRVVPGRKHHRLRRLARILRSASDTLDFAASLICLRLPGFRGLPLLGPALDRRNFLPVRREFAADADALNRARSVLRPAKQGSSAFELMLTSVSSARLKQCPYPRG